MDAQDLDAWKIAAFYHFTDVADRDELALKIVDLGLRLELRGTIILAHEGINSTCAGSHAAIDTLIDFFNVGRSFCGYGRKVLFCGFLSVSKV